MGMRLLTKKFTSYNIAKTGKDVMDLLDMGNLNMEKMLDMVVLGNKIKGKEFTLEDAGEKVDNFLSEDDNGVLDVYFQLLDEFDSDMKVMKMTGMSIKQLKEDMLGKVKEVQSNIEKVIEDNLDQVVLKPDEEVKKVGVDGFVTLD